MGSYLYSSQTAKKKKYPVPDTLSDEDIIEILHNHSVLSQILWPHSSATVRAETSTLSNLSKFSVKSVDTSFKATIHSHPNGATCTEELPLGFKITIAYSVADRERLAAEQSKGKNDLEAASTPPPRPDHQLYLIEEKSMTALKPAMLLMRWKDEDTIPKTRNLLQVLESLGGAGKDVLSALADLNGMAMPGDAGISVEKARNE